MAFSPLQIHGTLIQTKIKPKQFFYCFRKSSSKKNLFPSVYLIGTTSFDECFLFHEMNGKHYFLYEFIVILSFFFNLHIVALWKSSEERCVLKEVNVLGRLSPQQHYSDNIKSEKKYFQISLTNFISWRRFLHSFILWMHMFTS